MGFYSASQLVQDAKRHAIDIFPVDINCSRYDNILEKTPSNTHSNPWGIRLGFSQVISLNKEKAQAIELHRGAKPFQSLQDLARRAQLTNTDLQCLASADVLRPLSGNRHQSRWQAAAIAPFSTLLEHAEQNAQDDLLTTPPSLEKEVMDDYITQGLTLRTHPMALLRDEYPFNRCKKHNELKDLGHGRFVRIAGLVTGRQRPGTANGTLFLTLEDETGNTSVVVWKGTQENFRQPLLTAKLLLVKGVVEMNNDNVTHPVIHVVAGQLHDYSARLDKLALQSRDFH